jgi:hypothetical protein
MRLFDTLLEARVLIERWRVDCRRTQATILNNINR